MSADLKDLTAPDPNGMARAITAALADATLSPDMIDYVNAHGTGTTANDNAETAALHRSFGAHARGNLLSRPQNLLSVIHLAPRAHWNLSPPSWQFVMVSFRRP